MMRRPSRSTLLPNTTLFRSVLEDVRRAADADAASLCELAGSDILVVASTGYDTRAVEPWRRQAADDETDRKSTRLNSSHANISYAVFCLKKKHLISTNANIA